MIPTQLTIYTVLTGSKEPLGSPLAELDPTAPPSDLDIRWVCFTDDPDLRSEVWQMRLLDEPLPPERLSRRPKMLPHEYLPDAEWSLYIDNIVRFRRLPKRDDLQLGSHVEHSAQQLFAFRHATRKELVSEAEAIVQLGYERVGSLVRQLDHYRKLGQLERVRELSTCTLLLRNHHHPLNRRLGQLWWEQFLLFGKRDQMSFNVAVQQAGAQVTHWPGLKNDCPWLVNVANIGKHRVLASFDPIRYRWRYRNDPRALANPRQHYREVGAHDGRDHGQPPELLEWLSYRHGASLGRQVSPRRALALQLEAWLTPRRAAGQPFLLVTIEGGQGPAAFAAAELDAAASALAHYLPGSGQRLALKAEELAAGALQVQGLATERFPLLLVLGAAESDLVLLARGLAPLMAPDDGMLVLALREAAEVDAVLATEQALQVALAQRGRAPRAQAAVQATQHDDLDQPLRNSLLAIAWKALPADAAAAPGAVTAAQSAPPKKRYIAYCTSGMGNRLRPLASAIAYCQATGRELWVYWDDVTPNGCLTPWRDLFTTAIQPITLDELAALDPKTTALFTEKGPGHGVEREAARHERPQLLNLARAGAKLAHAQALTLDETADTVVVYDNNYLQCLPREASIEALRSLNPHPAVRAKAMATAAQLGLTPDTPAVHARGTDFNMKEALAQYAAVIDAQIPNGAFFLSTEDAELEAGLRARYGERVKSRPDRLHLRLQEGKTSWSDPDSYVITREHGIDALVDIYLLASVRLTVFHPGSTFSEIARHLHGVLQGLPAPQDPWPAKPENALGRAKQRFAKSVQALMPRGGAAYDLDTDNGPAGPLTPEQLPPAFFYWETLGYRLPLMERLFMNSYSGQPVLHWDGTVFNQLAAIPFEQFPQDLFKRLCPYPEAWSQMATLRGYISGRKVLVIGSESYWIELLCALAGAAEVTTVEYRPIEWKGEAPKAALNTLTWDQYIADLDAHAQRYDLILTYSSIEHSGLGRYGDRLTPLGDLFTFQLMADCLKPSGMCAVAVPTGQDLTHFNAHRIYGPQRIQAMEQVSGLRYIGIVYPDAAYLATDPEPALRAGWTLQALGSLPLGKYRQPILCFGREGFSQQRYLQG
ncbi:DUF268 domain-containing protein [Inhella sp.]|uniref:DUF268 domain-containing protein n=1 Tax=Inhella sp. TaxID=1921806 RepID=UPI0035B285D1